MKNPMLFPVAASRCFHVVLVGLVLLLTSARVAADNSPTFLFEPLLDTWIGDQNGQINFFMKPYDIAFPPDEPLTAVVAVVNDQNTVVASFPFGETYGPRTANGVIAQARLSAGAGVQLTEPGVYNIAFMVGGEVVSRLPVVLEQVEIGDDAFDRQTIYRYYGLWHLYAHITNDIWQGENWPRLTFWAGIRDFPQQAHQQRFWVEMKRDGEVVAHSKHDQGSFGYKHYQRVHTHLYFPHDEQSSANAIPFSEAEWKRDGDYEITITRKPDGAVFRQFVYIVKNGEILPLPETQLGHEPAIDYRAPRVRKPGSTTYEFVEAIWIKAPLSSS